MRLPPDEEIRKLFPRSLEGAADHQRTLAQRVSTDSTRPDPAMVTGADVAYSLTERRLFASAIAFDTRSRSAIATGRHVGPIEIPYVPGFLSYREGPALLSALAELQAEPELLLCDGHGIAHPRRFGIACHLGVALDLPAIGVAKSVLVGTYDEPAQERGAASALVHRGERIGTALRTRSGVRPVFVSPGHLLSLDEAVRIVLDWSGRVKLPEPVHAADREVAAMRRRDGGAVARESGAE